MRFTISSSIRLKVCAVSAAVLSVSAIASAEELKVVDVAGNTRLISEVPQQERVALQVVLASAETYPIEVRLSGLQNSDDIRSIQVGADGHGTFTDVGPGGYQLYTSAGAESIADVQISTDEPQQMAALVGGQTGAAEGAVEGAGAVGDGSAVAGGGAAGAGGAGGAGVGLGAVGAVGAVGGGVAILASSISSETDGKPAPSPTPAPPPSLN